MIQRLWGTTKGERPFEWEIDPRHPWVAGLLAFWSFDEGGGSKAYDSVGPNHGVFASSTNSPTRINTPFGPAVNFAGASSQYITPTFTAAPNLMTIAACAQLASAANFPMVVSFNAVHELRYKSGNGTPDITFTPTDNSLVEATSATNVAGDGKYHCITASYGTASAVIYLDGKAPVTTAHAGLALRWTAVSPLCFGIRNTSSNPFTGSMLWAAIWNRPLSAAEHAEIGASPNAIQQIYRKRRRQVFWAPRALVLTASKGTFIETGVVANLLYGRKLVATTGTFIETGQSANLMYSRRLVASTGVFTETGNAANLLYGRRLIASAGTFTETGNAANLLYGRRLIASAGSFTETGNAANLLYGRMLIAGTGNFTETGNAAGLYRGYRLVAAPGSFSETGVSAALLHGRTLSAGTGVFVVSGKPAIFIVAAATPQLFREALEARLLSSTALAALVDNRIFYAVLPQKLDLGRDGPALTFMVVGRPTGKILTGSDGTATARVQFSAWAYTEKLADQVTEVIRNMFDGIQPVWGNGTLIVTGCYQEDEVDLPEQPRAGSDQWTYQIASDYSIKHRVSLPTLS